MVGTFVFTATLTGATAAQAVTAEAAEAYSTYSCHYHYSSYYGNERFCYIDWNWGEEVFQRRVDGWHVWYGGQWVRTAASHYHSGWV